jgi:hypothetical protein
MERSMHKTTSDAEFDKAHGRNTDGHPKEEPYAQLFVLDAGDDTTKPPPREWLLGNVFARRFLSTLFGDGGVGKTAVRCAQYLSLALGRSLTGEHIFQRCRVLIVSLEDEEAEKQLRHANEQLALSRAYPGRERK